MRWLMLSLAVAALCLVSEQAEARGRRGGCNGGSCGMSTGCPGGQCQAPAPASPVPAAPAMESEVPAAPGTTEVKKATTTPVVQSSNDSGTRRTARWRSGGRRFR